MLPRENDLEQRLANFYHKSTGCILGFAGHVISVATIIYINVNTILVGCTKMGIWSTQMYLLYLLTPDGEN